ncbi:UFL1 family protein [Leptomonas pyrrhocoris]|uniref:UFL1 family protein n=1 Tax=Leptomonas pyrrhocoris TaxID=157538 RepID=A0A0N0DWJ4_LEPPY|nr:UFL1 family protein [Leptomonas pyrrhocoris]XP_015660328.1 UFL1 family protein [Leptomonas pyrrhocoris]KPA81888.1 UFL1 family protein [Leptomonas pyrrhocoris]KPA81889.1 UFL1 family protein [Leptomonas pyrrhocoris]|eukprot:XP_015660327.1 UFL1 family protein [Leptomonas pyrrhocoris]
MDDVELSELVRKFQSLQREEVSNQITERNAVEIVNSLIQKKLVDLLFTTDAKEYLTWDELKREIVDEVVANGGRLNVVDLPGLLSVHTFQVERVLPSVLEENPSMILESGELMTEGYLDSIVLAAGDLLREQGSLAVTQFASMHQLTSVFAKDLLQKAIEKALLDAVMQSSSLYTKQFVKLQRMIVRAGLLAAEEPVRLDAFYKRNALFLPLLDTVVEAVRTELPGSFDNYHTYVPRVFEAKRTAEVQNLYASNGYIEYAPLQRQGIHNPRQYLVEHYNPAEAVLDGPESPSASPTSSGSPHGRRGRRKGQGGGKPVNAAKEVGRTLVRASAEHPLCGYPLANGFVSDRFISNLPAVQSVAEGEVLAVDVTEQLPLFVEVEKDWPALEPRLRELYPGLERVSLVAESVLLSPAAEEKVNAALPAAFRAASKSKLNPSAVAADTIASVLKLPRDRYAEVLRELSDMWADAIDVVQQQLGASAAKSAAAELKQSRASLQEELAARWIDLGILAKGVEWAVAQLDEQVAAAIVRNVMATHAYHLARQVIRNESLDSPELSDKVAVALSDVSQPAQLKKALQPFSESRRNSLQPIITTLTGKSLEPFLETLREMGSSGVIAVASFHAPSKKVERDVYTRMKEAAVEEARSSPASSEDAAANGRLLSAICTLLIHLVFHCAVDIPGKAVGGVVTRLMAETAVPRTLEPAKESVISALQNNAVGSAGAALLEELRQAVLAMA